VGAENLCHQAIFMNHASGAVAPPDAEVVQVSDACTAPELDAKAVTCGLAC
jgi:hypothetical protein